MASDALYRYSLLIHALSERYPRAILPRVFEMPMAERSSEARSLLTESSRARSCFEGK